MYICTLSEKKKHLTDAEEMVLEIERWPRPGTRPWEVEAVKNFHRIENLIERMKGKVLDNSTIIH